MPSGIRIVADLTMSLFAGRDSKYMARANKLARKRDGNKCRVCSKKGKNAVHHLEGWATNRFLRFVPSNLITLCTNCHRNFHMWNGGYHVPCTQALFKKWLRVRKK